MRLDTDPTVWAGVPDVPAVTTGLGGLLDRYERDVAVTGVLTSFVTGGRRRRSRCWCSRSPRSSVRSAATGRCGCCGPAVRPAPRCSPSSASRRACSRVPLAVLAAAAVVLLVPGETTTAAWVEVALVVVLPPTSWRVVATARRLRAIDEVAGESTRTVRAARRVVLEAAVVLLAVLAVTTVRSRGAVIASGRTDWYAAVTPVLVALAAAVVALRLLPWPVRRLAGVAERGRGLVAFVGLTRAARTGAGDGACRSRPSSSAPPS